MHTYLFQHFLVIVNLLCVLNQLFHDLFEFLK